MEVLTHYRLLVQINTRPQLLLIYTRWVAWAGKFLLEWPPLPFLSVSSLWQESTGKLCWLFCSFISSTHINRCEIKALFHTFIKESLDASELHCRKRLLRGTGGQTAQLFQCEMAMVILLFPLPHSISVRGKSLWFDKSNPQNIPAFKLQEKPISPLYGRQ